MNIIMDSNEYSKNPKIVEGILKYLNKLHEEHPKDEMFFDNKVIPQHLECGDYMFKNILVEHKALSDFSGSVQEGRIFQQAQDMLYTQQQFPETKPFILISGNIADIFKLPHGGSPESLIAAWASLNKLGIPTCFMGNQWFFIHGMVDLFIKFHDGKVREYSPVRKPQEFDDIILSNYCSLVGEKTAESLLKKFPVPRDLYCATKEKLLEVEGVGKDTAELIVTFSEGREKSWKEREERKKTERKKKEAKKQ